MHGCLEQTAEGLEPPLFKADGVKPRQSPILACCIEEIRRGADCHSRQDGFLIAPSVKAVVAHPNRNVEVEPDWQTPLGRPSTTALELFMRRPLQKFKKANARVLALAQRTKRGFVALPPFLWPLPPGRGKPAAQIFKTRKPGERKRMVLPEAIECLVSLRRSTFAKGLISRLQSAHLDARDCIVVQHVGGAQALDLVPQRRFCAIRKFRDGIDVNIQRIEKQPAVGIIGTQFFRPVVKQGMQWIEADAGSS